MAKKTAPQELTVEARQVSEAIAVFEENKQPVEMRHHAWCISLKEPAPGEERAECNCEGIPFDPNVGPLHRNTLEGS